AWTPTPSRGYECGPGGCRWQLAARGNLLRNRAGTPYGQLALEQSHYGGGACTQLHARACHDRRSEVACTFCWREHLGVAAARYWRAMCCAVCHELRNQPDYDQATTRERPVVSVAHVSIQDFAFVPEYIEIAAARP